MVINDKVIDDEKIKYDINREAAKYQQYHLRKVININTLQVKKYFLLIDDKKYKKLSLYILL